MRKRNSGVTRISGNDLDVELATSEWSEILRFLTTCGWSPPFPVHNLLAAEFQVPEDVAQYLWQAGKIVQEESLNDPAGMVASVRFNMGTFAGIVLIAEQGAFLVENS